MSKYTNEELQKLAAGIFKSSPHTKVVYAASNGTFLNENQYSGRLQEGKIKESDYLKIENPAHKEEAKAAKAIKAKPAEAEYVGGDESETESGDDEAEGDEAKGGKKSKPKGK